MSRIVEGAISVILYDDDCVGIMLADDATGLFTPEIAVEIAQSLIDAAKEADPTLDVETVMHNYRVAHGTEVH